MTLSASDRVDRLLCGKQIFPFDWMNHPIFMYPRPEHGTEYTTRLTNAMKLAEVAAQESTYGLNLAFRASAMSNGELAYELVNNCTGSQLQGVLSFGLSRFGKPVKTTQNLKNTVAGSELMNRVIMPNREADYRAGNVIEGRFKDHAVVYPIIFENAIRTQKANPALSQGATPQDWTFEYWWGMRVIAMDKHILGGEKRYASRYLGVEDMIADVIQCGMLDGYREGLACPGKQYDVVDEQGRHVSLADRAWGRAKHIFEKTEDNFATDLAIGALIGQFMIDDWLRGKGQPVGFDPIDMKKVHPVLAKRNKEELARMDRLKEMMLPYLAEKCVGFVPYLEDQNLKKYVEEKILPAKNDFKNLDMGKMRKALFSEKILGDLNSSDIKKTKNSVTTKFDRAAQSDFHPGKPAKRRDSDGKFFQTPARLFEDNHFRKLSLWEQAALPFIMGAMESYRLPESAPRALFYVAEPKGGARAKAFMEQNGVDWLKEAYAAEDQLQSSSFTKQVIDKNCEQTNKDVGLLARMNTVKERGIRNILSTNNFLNIAAAAEKYREFVAAKGPQKLSPRGRLALMMEWMDRNPEAVAFRKEWSIHHDEASLMVRALQIATGLVKRPYNGGDYRMEIFAYDDKAKKLQKQDLYDLIKNLGQTVKPMLDQSEPPPAKEHYLAMARMIQILDMYMDPGRMNRKLESDRQDGSVYGEEIIQWREVDPALMAFWHDDPAKKAEVKAFREEIRGKLLNVAVLYFDEHDLGGLHDDYKAAWNKAHGDEASARRKEYEGRKTNQKWEGPT